MTPAEIRAAVDLMVPRATPEGRMNAQHVAIETTLRERHGHPLWIAELDQPGAYLPPPSSADELLRAAALLEAVGGIDNEHSTAAVLAVLQPLLAGDVPVTTQEAAAALRAAAGEVSP